MNRGDGADPLEANPDLPKKIVMKLGWREGVCGQQATRYLHLQDGGSYRACVSPTLQGKLDYSLGNSRKTLARLCWDSRTERM